jgi:Ras-related protein Rab-7A
MAETVSKTCKVIVLGNKGVGKTAVVHMFTSGEFRADFQATMGVDFSTAWIEIDGESIELQIWDTAGEERHDALAPRYYRGAEACLLVFDISDMASFRNIDKWHRHFIDQGEIDEPETFPFIVFGNKCDIEGGAEVSIEEARAALGQQNIVLVEVSAKTGQNIKEGFESLIRRFLEWRRTVGRGAIMTRIPPAVNMEATEETSSCC